MAFHYDYKPPGRRKFKGRIEDQFKRFRKGNVITAVIIIVVIGIFAVGAFSITGFVTYTQDMEQELNETTIALDNTKVKLDECNTNLFNSLDKITDLENRLQDSSGLLIECEGVKADLNSYANELNALLTTCEGEKAEVEKNYQDSLDTIADLENTRDTVIKKSARSVCCSFADVENSVIRNWTVVDNGVVCDGNHTINCGTGETG